MARLWEVLRGTCRELAEGHSMICIGNPSPSQLFPTCVIGNPSTLVMPDIFNRASIWSFFQMNPRLPLAGMPQKRTWQAQNSSGIASQMKFRFSHLHEAIGILFGQTFLAESFTTHTSTQPKRVNSAQRGAGRLFLVCVIRCSPFCYHAHYP